MANRRDFTNQHGAFVPTETTAINNLNGKKPVEEEDEIVVKKHKQILNEEDLRKMGKSKRFDFFKKEEEEEELPKTPTIYEREVLSEAEKKRRKAEYMKKYYAEHKQAFAEASKRFYKKRHPQKKVAEPFDFDTGHTYVDIDGIRIVKEGKKIVGWYRHDGWLE